MQRPKVRISRRTLLFVAIGVMILFSIAGRIFSKPPGSGETAVDTTGGSANQPSQSTSAPTETNATPGIANLKSKQVISQSGPVVLLNPGVVRQGATVAVSGGSFGAGAPLDLIIKQSQSDKGQRVATVKTDKWGSFGTSVTVPESMPAGSFILEVHQHNSKNTADATGIVSGAAPQVKLGEQVGKPGDKVEVSMNGFAPGEDVKVYWNGLRGDPIATLHTSQGGTVGQAFIKVPFGAVGNNSFVFMGSKSQSPVTASFLLLTLYPTVKVSNYAVKADNSIGFSGKNFGSGERVIVYLNKAGGQPLATIQADGTGSFSASGLDIPFGFKGKQTLIFIGEISRAPATVTFNVMPYTPNVQPSAYGGRPGTTISFYAVGFARNEVVHVYAGGQNGGMVSCFRTNNKGSAGAAGSYIIPSDVQSGKLTLRFVGTKSSATTVTTVDVMPAGEAVNIPPAPPFKCPLDQPSANSSTPAPNSGGQSTMPAPTPLPTEAPQQNQNGQPGQ